MGYVSVSVVQLAEGGSVINGATPSNFLITQTLDPKHVIWNKENTAVHLSTDCDSILQLGPHD